MSEKIYIVATYVDAKQDLFKVATSKDLEAASNQLLLLKTFEVTNAEQAKLKIHTTLHGLSYKNLSNAYRCPFKFFVELIEHIIKDNSSNSKDICFFIDVIKMLRTDNIWTYGITNKEFLTIDEKMKAAQL